MTGLDTLTAPTAPPWWDDAVTQAPDATVFQSAAWGRYIGADRDVRYVWAITDGRPIGLLLTQGPRLRRPRGFRTLRDDPGHCTWRHGPLVIDGDPGVITGALLGDVDRHARRAGIRRVEGATAPLGAAPAVHTAYANLGYQHDTAATMLVDLTPSIDELWRNLKPSARKALAAAERAGLTVRRLERDEPLDDYLTILGETRRRLGLPLPPHHPTAAMRQAFAGSASALEVFVAMRGDRIMGGLGVIGFGDTASEIAVAQSDEAAHDRLYTGDVIKWAVLQWAKDHKYRRYDLGGVEPDPKDAKAAGIRQFKEKWGGALVEYAVYRRHRRGVIRRLLGR
ncbi:MAG: peptidoglycan bridge formation glycyltransferase FemA/FemB family protein [Candidatus Rokubacteria bacterium]|nr:peptidoglycan bridge formation glycyltransferase FemA/FemB family protein [Candidatus Rokubacteria bacterium]